MKNRFCLSKIAIRIYCRLFIWGHRVGCHQRPERSFFYKSYQFPVCARCTGVLIGYVIAILFYCIFGHKCFPSSFVCFVMLFDWLLQFAGIKESTNNRRLVTGTLGGYGIMMFQIKCVTFLMQVLSDCL